MKTFDVLYNDVMKRERGYNPNDQGYETYSGIWRHSHGDWAGWKAIDAIKKTRKIKAGEYLSAIESLVKIFYQSFWAPCKVDSINEPKIAQLIVDMKTQHGSWARIINAGLSGQNPLSGTAPNKAISNTFADTAIAQINADPAKAYTAIATARLKYSTGVGLANERDRKNIIARAKQFVNDAVNFIANNSTEAGGLGIVLISMFFF